MTTDRFDWLNADAYLFDIDGTLLNTRDLVHWDALNRAMLEAYGVHTTIAGVIFHGKTDVGILRTALARVGVDDGAFEAKLPQALAAIRQHVSENRSQFVAEVCPAIPEVLAALQRKRKLVGIASGNLASVGWHKVEAAGLRKFFSFGCFSDRREMRADVFRDAVTEVRRQIGEQATVCFVGDTPEDVKAARSADAQVIAVCTGIYKSDQLALLAPDACVASCAELLALQPCP
jgi:phosphoglycolate phosphatase-like HAD superfamily hydrolase